MSELLVRNYINGTLVDGIDGATSELVDPCTAAVYGRAVLSGPADVDAACRAAAEAFRTWKETTPSNAKQRC